MQNSRSIEGNIKVYSRFRPMNPREISVSVKPIHRKLSRTSVCIDTQKERDERNFTFDGVFDVNSTQAEVYQVVASPIVASLFEGFNGTIFAYGQTASGKTYTMQGLPTLINPDKCGIIPRSVEQIFSTIEASPCSINFTLKISVIEIYLEKIKDLITPSNIDLKIRSQPKRGTFVEGVTQEYVASREQLMALFTHAADNRAICSTKQNDRSSRSHFIMTITVGQQDTDKLLARSGKLYLVDLAGSEKSSKSGSDGKTLHEGNKINTSLTSLGKVIKALSDSRHQHIPYRQSKLTRILQQSLGGNSRTALIVTCSPHIGNLSETLSTLRFGVSTRKIRNKAVTNKQLSFNQLQILLDKIQTESSEKSHKIFLLEKFIKRELGKVPDIGLQASTCCSCYIGKGSSSSERADAQCQSPTKSEVAQDMTSDQDSGLRYNQSESEDYFTGRSGDVSFERSQYEVLSQPNLVMQEESWKVRTQQNGKRLNKMPFNFKISCSNVAQPDVAECDQKPLTERTPRWVDIENPQQVEKMLDKIELCYMQSIVPVVNEFYGKSNQASSNRSHVEQFSGRPQLKNNTSGTNSLDTSFCTPQEQNQFEYHLSLVTSLEGIENLPTSRHYDPSQRQSSVNQTPQHRNNTIMEELDQSDIRDSHVDMRNDNVDMTWKEHSDMFRKRLLKKCEQSDQLSQQLEQLRQMRQIIRDRFRKSVMGGSTSNTPRNIL